MKKHAFYHQPGKASIRLNVLKEHEDGTVDLGMADGTLVVSRCEMWVGVEVAGCCSPDLEGESAAAKKAADDAAAKKAADDAAAKKAADDAAAKKAADDAAAKKKTP